MIGKHFVYVLSYNHAGPQESIICTSDSKLICFEYIWMLFYSDYEYILIALNLQHMQAVEIKVDLHKLDKHSYKPGNIVKPIHKFYI